MSKKLAWFHVGLILAMFLLTPIVSYKFGTPAGCITFGVFFLSFCYWPTKNGESNSN